MVLPFLSPVDLCSSAAITLNSPYLWGPHSSHGNAEAESNIRNSQQRAQVRGCLYLNEAAERARAGAPRCWGCRYIRARS